MKKTLISTLCFISLMACDAELGFGDKDESTNPNDPENSTRFIGPSEGFSWSLALSKDSDKTFTLTKQEKPDSDKTYDILGTYTTANSGLLELTIDTSKQEKPAAVKDGKLYAVRVGNNNVIFLPFENTGADTLLVLSTADNCPSSTANLNWMGLDESTSQTLPYTGTLSYSKSEKKISYDKGVALSEGFPFAAMDAVETADCEAGGFAKSASGNHYLSLGSAIIEMRDPPYRRLITQSQKQLQNFDALHDDSYYGVIEINGGMANSVAISGKCLEQRCEISLQNQADEFESSPAVDYTLNLPILGNIIVNDPANGMLRGKLTNTANAEGNVLCIVDSGVANGSEPLKSMYCVAQNPSTPTSTIYFMMVAK